MEKLKELVLGMNIPMIAFIVYTAKVVLISPTYPETIVLAIIAGVYGYKMKIDPFVKNMQKPNDKLVKDVQELKNALSKINISQTSKPPRRF